jgi:hypothetical protein
VAPPCLDDFLEFLEKVKAENNEIRDKLAQINGKINYKIGSTYRIFIKYKSKSRRIY